MVPPVVVDIPGVCVGKFVLPLGDGAGAEPFLYPPLLTALGAIIAPVGRFYLEWSLHLPGEAMVEGRREIFRSISIFTIDSQLQEGFSVSFSIG